MTAARSLFSGVVVILAFILFRPDTVFAQPANGVTAPVEADSDRETRAHALIQSGIYAYKKRDYIAARYSFLEAYELGIMSSTAAMLADTEMKLQRYRDAAEHWQAYLEQLPADQSRERTDATGQLAECRRHLGSIRPILSPKEAHVLVDGIQADTKVREDGLWLDPGTYSLRAVLGDRSSPHQEVALQAGDAKEIQLIVPPPSPTPVPPRITPPRRPIPAQVKVDPVVSPDSQSTSKTVVLLSGSLLTLAAGAISLGFLVQNKVLYGDAKDARADVLRQAEKTGTPEYRACKGNDAPAACGVVANKAEAMGRAAEASLYAAIAAGTLGAATVATWLLWPKPKSSQTARSTLTLTPWIAPKDRGLALQLEF